MKTLEKIAEKFGTKVWEKGDKKRVYLNNFGYNTKKMKTTCYVYEENGELKVAVFIDCPSQPYSWIKSQVNEVRNLILDELENENK